MAFENIIDGVFKWEAGYQKNTKDKGNFYEGKLVGTNFGISAPTLAEYLGRPPTSEDMQNLTKEEAKKIYKINYYDRYKIDKLPEDIQEIALHSVVMSGSNGIKDIQKLIGVEADGGIGPNTLKALEKQKISSGELKNAILDRYKGYKNWDEFGKGWTNRYNDIVPETKKEEAPEKQSSFSLIKAANASDKVPIGGIAQLDQEVVKPYNSFGLRNNNLNENVQESFTTGTIENIAPSRFDIQENARRSMMQGNYQDRMDDYDYAREQAQRPYVNRYPVDSRGQGAYSTAAPMRNQAARMMGFAKGGLINTQGPRPMNNLKTQAQGLAALGRGGDSTLVHMQPGEVAGLQQLAQANGTSLTINPATGMPEAFNLGGLFKAALPIAAGFMTGGAATPFFGNGAIGSMLSKPLVAGALTGAVTAGATGDDPIMGAVTGGFGGMSGAGLQSAMAGVPEAMQATGAIPNDMGQQLAAQNAYTESLGAMQNPDALGMGQASTSMMTPQASMNPFQADGLSGTSPMGRGYDKMAMNVGTPEMVGTTKYLGGEQMMESTGNITPGGPLQVANRIGGPAASLALGGLEESDFYEDVEFSDPRDKYNPNSKLNLNRDTGIAAALSKDTGLRLYAEGGEVGGGVTGAGLAPGTPVASIGGGVTGRGLAPGTPVAGAMAGAKPHAAPGMESFDSMVASGVHPANAAAMHGMDPRPFLDLPTAPAAGYARKPEVMESPYGASTRSRKAYGGRPRRYATGGYLNTGGEIGDGMSDDIQATINNNQPAALSDGEFVVPADVVSHLGNGSSDAGAKRLYDMMDKVRKARTGTKKQGREINPEKMMPK